MRAATPEDHLFSACQARALGEIPYIGSVVEGIFQAIVCLYVGSTSHLFNVYVFGTYHAAI